MEEAKARTLGEYFAGLDPEEAAHPQALDRPADVPRRVREDLVGPSRRTIRT